MHRSTYVIHMYSIKHMFKKYNMHTMKYSVHAVYTVRLQHHVTQYVMLFNFRFLSVYVGRTTCVYYLFGKVYSNYVPVTYINTCVC